VFTHVVLELDVMLVKVKIILELLFLHVEESASEPCKCVLVYGLVAFIDFKLTIEVVLDVTLH
jgi:hypothetical protein